MLMIGGLWMLWMVRMLMIDGLLKMMVWGLVDVRIVVVLVLMLLVLALEMQIQVQVLEVFVLVKLVQMVLEFEAFDLLRSPVGQ